MKTAIKDFVEIYEEKAKEILDKLEYIERIEKEYQAAIEEITTITSSNGKIYSIGDKLPAIETEEKFAESAGHVHDNCYSILVDPLNEKDQYVRIIIELDLSEEYYTIKSFCFSERNITNWTISKLKIIEL